MTPMVTQKVRDRIAMLLCGRIVMGVPVHCVIAGLGRAYFGGMIDLRCGMVLVI